MNTHIGRALRAASLVAIALLSMPAAQAQQIISAVQSEQDPGDALDKRVTTSAGALVSTTFGGADTRALTDFGLNRIHVKGNADYKQYATSAWLDSYTVGGAAGTMVDLTFTLNVHGATNIDAPGHAYNFEFYALRGDNWSMSGSGSTTYDTPNDPTNQGDQYEALLFRQTRADGSFSQIDARDFTGVSNYSAAGDFLSGNIYDAQGDVFTRTTMSNGNTITEQFYADRYVRFTNGMMNFTIPYNIPQGAGPLGGRRNLEAQYQVLGVTSFCNFPDDECGSLVTNPRGLDLTVNFRLAAGSTFSLAGYLFADDFTTGTADFFNTVKLTGIGVSGGASLASASGSLVDLGNGQFGYRAVIDATGGVPEPSSWALLILGFGVVGAGLRRRQAPLACAC